MKLHFSLTTVAMILGLLLGACAGGSNQAVTSEAPETTEATEAPSDSSADNTSEENSPTATSEATDHSAPQQGGQVLEVGAYHLEFVAAPEESGTHLDLFLQTGDTHEAIPGATVTGQIQLPDGSQQQVDFEYDAAGQHYAALLPETAPGEYQVVILTDISGEKVNGRFSFTK